MAEIEVGAPAPDFTLDTDGGGTVTLSALRGQAVVLYFYPEDDTPGCTVEAIEFTAHAPAFGALNATIIGISPDNVKSHDRFKAKHGLTIRLAADPDKKAIGAYGVWVKKNKFGREYMGVERATYLVRRDGKIAHIWRKVTAAGHAEAVLEKVKSLGP